MKPLVCSSVLLLATGCQRPLVPDLGGLYDQAASFHGEGRNPVILIPGILGSKLRDSESDRIVWGAFSGDFANPREEEGARLFTLPMREGVPLDELTDSVRPDGALDTFKVSLFGLPIFLDAYRRILGVLGVAGYRDEELGESGAIEYGTDHYTCFQFAYDWRRDVSESAAKLHEFILAREAYVRRETEERYGRAPEQIRFDIVAHSMGGLVTRYYLRYGDAPLADDGSLPELTWKGAEKVERAVFIGTPNAGSINALTQLVRGVKLGPFTPRYEPAIVGTLPAIYQLLPRSRHEVLVGPDGSDEVYEDLLDPKLWVRMRWGLADPGQDDVLAQLLPHAADAAERRRIALDHLSKCLVRARQFAAALDLPASPPEGLDLYLVAGDAVDTGRTAEVDPESGAVSLTADGPGDGTVLRSSALMDERAGGEWQPYLVSPIDWTQVLFLFRDHLGLTEDPAFTDNVLYILLEDPR